ncbi:MAG: hypothetical protein SFY56_15010 [Bacteroidota bacterium]|nr:hypothetical protein [Bacteroidota bacterium]
MRQQKTYQLLFCVMCFFTVKSFSQTSSKKLANINAFNSILGNYFYVDANLSILPRCTNNDISFDTLYALIKNNFNTNFNYNLESRQELKSPSSNVITLNLKFDKNGCCINETRRTFKKDKNKTYFVFSRKQIDSVFWRTKNYSAITNGEQFNELLTLDENGRNLSLLADQINDTVNKLNISNIVFFVHGYNVPHSLAQLQGNQLISTLAQLHPDKKYLFIRVFWDGGDRKKFSVRYKKNKTGELKLKCFTYKNTISLTNGLKFGEKRKQASDYGISLRRLLVLLQQYDALKSKQYYMVTHSLGAIVATSSLINNVNDLYVKKKWFRNYIYNNNFQTDSLNLNTIEKRVKKNKWLTSNKTINNNNSLKNYLKIAAIKHIHLPDLNVKLFLNAPAIAGVDLFKHADLEKNYHYNIGHNIFDPILAKRFLFQNVMLSGYFSQLFGTTSLGLNYNNEVGMTQFVLSKKAKSFKQKYPSKEVHFKLSAFQTSDVFDHDLFTYSKNPLFLKAFQSYFE